MNAVTKISGNIVDVVSGKIFHGSIKIGNRRIISVTEEDVTSDHFILPGLVDAHIHIESSMLIPSEFARLAVVHGTVATVSDPHEIANVLGIPGVKFMIENGAKVPFKFNFGAPSCVPATSFETAGAKLGVAEVESLLSMKEILYLSEMMNFPGVLNQDETVMAKLELARKAGKPIDGHAPGLTGEAAGRYIAAGISTDHECFTIEEALNKIRYGMKILIREGSAAKNFDTLHSLITEYPEQVMLCSDDKHPNDLVAGHINQLVQKALALGHDPVRVIRCCTLNPVRHYKLPVGLLQPGDPADFIVVNNLHDFKVLSTYIDGNMVAEYGKSLISSIRESPFNNFNISKLDVGALHVSPGTGKLTVLQAMDGQLITGEINVDPNIVDGNVVSDPGNDVLKIVVLNRYNESSPGIGFIRKMGIRKGAIASCVAHDSHNIIATGTDDGSLTEAINLIIEAKGGISLVDGDKRLILPLPFAGIMSGDDGYSVAATYDTLDKKAKELGSTLSAPYMTLSFMALLVIPSLKLSDKGLFDGNRFSFRELFEKK